MKLKPISNWIFKKRINQSLSSIPGEFIASQNDNFYVFYNTLNQSYFYLVPKKRVENTTVVGFFLWTIGISFILSLNLLFFYQKTNSTT